LTVLNNGANLEIDISKSKIKNVIHRGGIPDQITHDRLERFLTKCPVEVYGFQKNKKILFGKPFLSVSGNDNIWLVFPIKNPKGITRIDELNIRSSCPIDHVKIYWKNYSE
jgi:hypothetical protein